MNENNDILEKLLEQNQELMNIMSDTVKSVTDAKEKSRRLPWIICGIVSFFAALTICATFVFFSQYEFYVVEETVYQDTNEGSGNNVYFPGENATYNESDKGEE